MTKKQLSTRQHRVSSKRVLGAIVALVVAFLLLASVIGLLGKYRIIRGRVGDLKDEREKLIEKQGSLAEKNRYIETKEGQEYELRSKYNVVKPGEEMIVISQFQSPEGADGRKSRVGRWWISLLKGVGLKKD